MVSGPAMTTDQLRDTVRSVPDFPKPGIVFRDVTTLLKDPVALRSAAQHLAEPYRRDSVDMVVGVESRGFIFGALLAEELGAGFVPIRKKGKLPAATRSEEYALEYGSDTIEIHTDALTPGSKVLLHDDLLATGGTMKAAIGLVSSMGATIVGLSFLIELTFLGGAARLAPHRISSVITYDSE